MIDAGDIYVADLNEEHRRRVLVVSVDRFNCLASRALVAPELPGLVADSDFPWRVVVDGAVFAVDRLRSLPLARLLQRADRAPAAAMDQIRQVLRTIM
jgi:mRNA-degrading endonuclease toxin of MazEF toxin-antitoxin module